MRNLRFRPAEKWAELRYGYGTGISVSTAGTDQIITLRELSAVRQLRDDCDAILREWDDK